MALTRTISLDDLTPKEIARRFCDMFGDEQAAFFDEVSSITADWPGAGWCKQACDIAERLSPAARAAVLKLAEHVSGQE